MTTPPREQRTVFGEVADLYDRARPSYPEELFDIVVEFGALAPGDRALEIGGGTGIATLPFMARGLDVVSLEPSPGMAAVLRAKGVAVEETHFESAVFDGSARLVFAGQSWHWVPPEARCKLALTALTPGGTLAVFWNVPRQFAGALFTGLDGAYATHAPQLRDGYKAFTELPRTEDELSAMFDDVTARRITWSQHYSTTAYIANLQTQSTHRLLPEEQRARLHGAIAQVIDSHGGTVEVVYDTLLFMARAPAPAGTT